MSERLSAIYRIRSTPDAVAERAQAVAVEQSVEMPLAAIDDPTVLDSIVARVETISQIDEALFEARITLAIATTGNEAGQLLNMLFGNTSLQEDVVLQDVVLPSGFAQGFGGPGLGASGLRRRLGATRRALTCSALKPQGLPPARLAALAGAMADGGIDLIKDDHGLADQDYSRFADRVQACADAVATATAATRHPTRYAPSLCGNLDQLRDQLHLVRETGLDTVLVAPMILGLPAFHTVTRAFPDIAFLAHPAMGGATRIAPTLLLGKLFRLFGADAVIFPNHGGRFGYSPEICRTLAVNTRAPWHGLHPSLPVPAGGMTRARVPEMLDFYGADVMVLIGGDLLAARDRLTEQTAAFVAQVHQHRYG